MTTKTVTKTQTEGAFAAPSVSAVIRPAKKAMFLSAVLTASGAVCAIVPYILLTHLAGLWLGERHYEGWRANPWYWVAGALICLCASQLLYLGGLGVSHTGEAKLRYQLRRQMVDKLARLPLGKVSGISPGRLRKIVVDDTAAVHTLVAHLPGDFTNAIISVVFGLSYLFWVSWQMALSMVLIWGLLTVVTGYLGFRNMGELTARFSHAQNDISAATVEMLQGISEIKNFQADDLGRTKFQIARKQFADASYSWMRKSGAAIGLLMAFLRPASIFATVAVLSVIFISHDWIAISDTLPFFLLAPTIPEGVSTFYSLMQHIYDARQAGLNSAQLLAEKSMVEGAEKTGFSEGDAVVFDNVTFRYTPEKTSLENVSFTVKCGTSCALVGASGSGKSTILRLIARFYDVESGAIKIGKTNIASMPFSWLYSHLAVVVQESQILHASVRDNITLADKAATDEEIIQAATDAQILDRIQQMPAGFDTILGEEGGFLSGGEKQRIALARIFLQKAPIVLLDEATAQTDPESERDIYKALAKLTVGRTVIMASHRLESVRYADQILVVDDGKIVQRGRHDELIRMPGKYRDLWHVQVRNFEGEDHGASESAGEEH
ncbi:MAG: ABC transporter ATP-binding protein [Actinomycetaceae bacterium]|nr:ABC transporter ATP-binding protein [Actinomycetaceae bacterium]